MTLEELWELFPIVLEPYQPCWQEWAEGEIGLLSGLLVDYNPLINHIGSTAIPGIYAKPIIDILIEVAGVAYFPKIRTIMETSGYICMAETSGRMSFNKGYTPYGYADRVFHIHIHLQGDNDEIYFRDYLRSHPEDAKRYETLKLSLLPRYQNNRDAYTAAKTDFIRHITFLAES